MEEQFRKFLSDGGLQKKTVEALEGIGVTNKDKMKEMTDEDVDNLKLDPVTGPGEKSILKVILQKLKGSVLGGGSPLGKLGF